jgi:hypothetical protein
MTVTPLPHPPEPPGIASGFPAADRRDPGPDAGTLAVANAALRGGFVLLPRTLLHAPGLSRDAKLLYAVLLSYAWQAGSCFPGYARLQADLGCGINQVTKYLRELEAGGLVTRRRRGLGKTTLYTVHDPPAPPSVKAHPPMPNPEGRLIHQIGESAVTEPVKAVSPDRRREEDSEEQDPDEHHPMVVRTTSPEPALPTLAPPTVPTQKPSGAVDDDALELLLTQGVTRRIAQELVQTHPGEAIRQQFAWQAYRPAATSPAGALVRAIRDSWPPPPAWVEAQEHATIVAHQAEADAQRRAEDEARRREWAAKPPEERIAGRLQFWLLGQRRKGREPTEAEIAAKRAELLAGLDAASGGAVAEGPR